MRRIEVCGDDGGSIDADPRLVTEIAVELRTNGIVRLGAALSSEWLAAAYADVEAYLKEHGPGDYDLLDHTEWHCPAICALAVDPGVEDLLRSVASLACESISDLDGYQRRVLHILDGTGSGKSRPYLWHYDASVITMLIPIVTPADGSGNLAAFPNRRPHRRSPWTNVLEKGRVQNELYGRRVAGQFNRNPSRYTVPLVPGDAYVFTGHRTLHTTLPWLPGQLRVGVSLHYGHPYGADNQVVRTGIALRDGLRQMRRHLPSAHLGRSASSV